MQPPPIIARNIKISSAFTILSFFVRTWRVFPTILSIESNLSISKK
jgi:hypothetical protein